MGFQRWQSGLVVTVGLKADLTVDPGRARHGAFGRLKVIGPFFAKG
jgi:hypothetical protein